MSTLELVRLALSRLSTSRTRSFLTMLGVIIGVASVVTLVSVAQGATSGISGQLESLGTNLVTVSPGSTTAGLTNLGAGSADTLTLDDATALGALEVVAQVAPQVTSRQLIVADDSNTTTTVVGTTPSYADVHSEDVWAGSFLSDVALANDLSHVVLGATTADDLGLGAEDIGREIRVGGQPFRLVGILQPKGGSSIFNQDDQAYAPVGTVQRHFVGGDSVRSIGVQVEDSEDIEVAKAALTAELRQRHGTTSTEDDDFSVTDQSQLLSTFSAIQGMLTALLAGIASISLVVGGIGIMNIMLVSVRERTREIGIRKAVGARGRDILVQFLVEALTLSTLGGLIGIAIGLALSALIAVAAGWAFSVSLTTLVVALAFSLGVGVVFGVWPARQAARLDPIAALRYE